MSTEDLTRVLSSPDRAYQYARHVIKGRWPEAEAAIAKDPRLAYDYAKDCGVKLKIQFEQ
jgi:hypothetical protein